MNTLTTNDVAEQIGVTPRKLRQFLRSSTSTFVAVGSGARYEFKDADVPVIRKRYAEWAGRDQARSTTQTTTPRSRSRRTDKPTQDEIDRAVWQEEEIENGGPVKLPDIRDLRVRARVRALAREQEERLEMLLLSKGLHVTQLGDRR